MDKNTLDEKCEDEIFLDMKINSVFCSNFEADIKVLPLATEAEMKLLIKKYVYSEMFIFVVC